MNICVVSTFDGTTNDYMEIFNSTKEKAANSFGDYDIGVVREGKIILMIDIIDKEKFQETMTSEEMIAWNDKFNCVDEVYSLEKFQETMTSEEMIAWNDKYNCVDEVYSLEKL